MSYEHTIKDYEAGTANNSETSSNENQERGEKETRPYVAYAIFILLGISAIVACLFLFGIISDDDLLDVPVIGDIDFDNFFDSDPYNGQVSAGNPEEAYRWPNDGVGLQLEIINALDETWQAEFDTGVQQWEGGEPDTLTLTTSREAYDFDCQAVPGTMKVCNGDYGETQWRGLNGVLLDFSNRYIYSSEAKMNEFYLKDASAAQRRYTMCHELGHGFGLPHWDVDFFNKNMGNCMDYTDSPRTNAQPDESNYEFLKALYGEVGGTRAPGAPTSNNGPSSSAPPPFMWGGDGRRKVQEESEVESEENSEEEESSIDGPPLEVTDDVVVAFQDAVSEWSVPDATSAGWEHLESDEAGDSYEMKLEGSDFVVRIYLLRA